MTRPASTTSRKTMMSAPSIELFRDERAFGGVLVILAEELVAAGIERIDLDHRALSAGNHFLGVEIVALELFGGSVSVGDRECQLLIPRALAARRVRSGDL